MKRWSPVLLLVAVLALAALPVASETPSATPPSEAPAADPEASSPAQADTDPSGPLSDAVQLGWEDPQYGTCYFDCEGDGWFETQDFQTYDECCFQFHACPNSSPRLGTYWNPYSGGQPTLCTG